MTFSLIFQRVWRAAILLTLALPLQHCALLPSRQADAPSVTRVVTGEGTASQDEVTTMPAVSRSNQKFLDDQVLQSHARQELSVQFQYKRESVPTLPEIEELQTLAAARERSHRLMAAKIYGLPLERRQTLGPALLDASPALRAELEEVITEQGRLEALWNKDRSQVEGRFTLAGQAVVDTIYKYIQSRGGVSAEGSSLSALSYHEVSAEHRQRLARERAIERARADLRQKLMAQPIRSNQTVGELIKRDPRQQARLENFVRSAPLKRDTTNADGSVTVAIEADASRLLDMLR